MKKNEKREDKKIEGILFGGVKAFPSRYHDNSYYRNVVDASDKKIKAFIDGLDPAFLETSGLFKKSTQEQ